MKKLQVKEWEILYDDEDHDVVIKYSWHVGGGRGERQYANTDIGGKCISMHKLLTGYAMTDHINRDGLDNRRSNLSPISNAQNLMNSRIRSDNKVGFKGVKKAGYSKKWVARIKHNGKEMYIGSFDTKEDAALAYDRMATALFGEYACTNKMLGLL